MPFQTGVALVDELKILVPAGMSLAMMALRWILDFDAITVVIPGSKTPTQVVENVAVAHLPRLTKDLHEQLTHFYDEKVARHIRGKY